MIRSLLVGAFLLGSGCPTHPVPPPVTPTDPIVDAGSADGQACNVPTATQDRLTGKITNACGNGKSLDAIAVTYDLTTVRCVMADILLDAREAPKLETCVRSWMSAHGGTP